MSSKILLRKPTSADGMPVHRLIANCPPLDTNSAYCNLLQCSHFADTSVAATQDGKLVGFISGYLIPGRSDSLFIWQVAVDESARGQGLAGKMLNHILSRSHCAQVKFIETTITQANAASWALFRSLAKRLGTKLDESVMFDRQTHYDDEHDTEMLVKVGPFELANADVSDEAAE